MKTHVIAVLLIVLFWTGASLAESKMHPSAIIDGVRLTIGASEQSVLSDLGKGHRVQKWEGELDGGAEGWEVESKSPPWEDFGSVAFVQGKLTNVSIAWANDHSAVAFGRALLGALSSAADTGTATSCIVIVRKHELPSGSFDAATIRCGSQEIIVGVGVSRDGKFDSSATVTQDVGNH